MKRRAAAPPKSISVKSAKSRMSGRVPLSQQVRNLQLAEAGDLQIDPKLATDILCTFLVNESSKFGFERAVLGVSGGLDSAVVAYLCAKAFGPRNVLGVLLPYRLSSPDSLKDGLEVIRKSRIRSELVDITPIADRYFERFQDLDQIRKGNVLARVRMLILFDLSQREKALVIGTSNKTELMLGYGTWYGDMASSINPVGDLYKAQLRQLAEYLRVPLRIRKKIPTADLWIGQTDEDELGLTYDQADHLLYLMIDELYSHNDLVVAGFPENLVTRVERMVYNSQFKRSLPIICKLSRRTVGIDFQLSKDWNK